MAVSLVGMIMSLGCNNREGPYGQMTRAGQREDRRQVCQEGGVLGGV